MRIALVVAMWVALLINVNGCGTMFSQKINHNWTDKTWKSKEEYKEETCGIPSVNMYSGIVFDIRVLSAPFICHGGGEGGLAFLSMYPIMAPLSILDIPLSFAADTIILPYTTYRQIKYGNQNKIEK